MRKKRYASTRRKRKIASLQKQVDALVSRDRVPRNPSVGSPWVWLRLAIVAAFAACIVAAIAT